MNKIVNYIKNLNLKKQLGYLVLISLVLSLISLVVILPKLLTPFYENNIYNLLSQPLSYQDKNTNNIVFIVKNNNGVYVSSDFNKMIDEKYVDNILLVATNNKGKFNIDSNTYYYTKNDKVISITDDSYIKNLEDNLRRIILPLVSITIFIITLVLVIWNNHIVNKITKIQEKVNNLNNNNYTHSYNFTINDELNSLINSVEYMRCEINTKEEYKNDMYQSLSHELKTPITVISSYVEAANDKIITYEDAVKTIGDEIKTLSDDVNKILELNKINYLKDTMESYEIIDITELLNEVITKYKIQRPDVNFLLDIKKINKVRGTYDTWRIVIDNLLSNFIRYADKNIKITFKRNKMMFYNDGEAIPDNLIRDVFTKYKMGIKGNFGLGLSIVKNSLELYGYKIKVENKDNGVLFTIE
ncbi:MAG: HAMP domain-containing sensor histidine kinase [bacterium]|nr:HAMP domain-containing sensor histidine kinase [bacterium]MDY4108057.1 HAMP domain-containing sensor histidine kinase [Bacilli bacterium]